MLRDYYSIIREALKSNRVKGNGSYYEAHHIVPKSFSKQSTVVLLTPQEHYNCHKILAESFKNHSIYGQKMLWAFHRLAYDKGRKLSAEEYAQARVILMSLWKRKKSEEHKAKIAKAQKGNVNNKARVYKGMKSDMTLEGKHKLAETRRREQTGKIGDQAKASKGWVVCEYEDGRTVEAGSALQLSYLIKVCPATITNRLKTPHTFKNSYKIYYKN
jgi:hypothetical protein